MGNKRSGSSGAGLERSCSESTTDWIRQVDAADGLELLEAWFQGPAYLKHRHDTYAIGLTDTGVQAFDYRGSAHISTPGNVVVLHPDELHDGYAGAETGFGYRLLYVDPALIFDAVRVLCGHACPLPFVRQPVLSNSTLADAIHAAFRDYREPLAIDDLIALLAEGLVDAAGCCKRTPIRRHLDVTAVERARQFLNEEKMRVVRSWELEAVTGLTRYDLARQFRMVVGTSPYRYLLMRRLRYARAQFALRRPLVDVALESGFADQAHLTRMFTAAFGIAPGRYLELREPGPRQDVALSSRSRTI